MICGGGEKDILEQTNCVFLLCDNETMVPLRRRQVHLGASMRIITNHNLSVWFTAKNVKDCVKESTETDRFDTQGLFQEKQLKATWHFVPWGIM